ncbi:MAG: hypothetical protein ACI9IL_000457 [Rickettsiales bacterium]|jgi:hypothetical protein
MDILSVNIFSLIAFVLAAYSVMANDAVQTLGTFIRSNRRILNWYQMFFFAGGIMVFTIWNSWYFNDGDISYSRLDAIPFHEPTSWMIIIPPLILVILTRLGIPISTTFIILSSFTSQIVFNKMLMKSFLGYGLAALVAFVVWMLVTKYFHQEKYPMSRESKKNWRIFQFITTAFLWYSWLSHDVANIAVYLPRSMDMYSMIIVTMVFVTFLLFMFYERGGKIQKIVKTKSGTKNVRAATLIDLVYVVILIYFKQYNNIPMSTTWVFIGLLTGRELAISLIGSGRVGLRATLPVVASDLAKVLFGLLVGVGMLVLLQGKF